jgi:CBS-domain-containing membrane protein
MNYSLFVDPYHQCLSLDGFQALCLGRTARSKKRCAITTRTEEGESMKESIKMECGPVDISEQDVLNAMKAIQGYLDITPADFKEVYRVAYSLATDRILNSLTAGDVMTTTVHCVGVEMDLVQAATLLAEKGISGAPVVDLDGKLDSMGLMMIIGSFGASAVLIYGAVRSPLAQPRNLMGGHILSALVGVIAYWYLGAQPWLAAALAVSVSIALMHQTKTLHPPGGATALIAVIGGDAVHQLGYLYVLMPIALGAAVMLAVALIVNNIPPGRRYPEFWL